MDPYYHLTVHVFPLTSRFNLKVKSFKQISIVLILVIEAYSLDIFHQFWKNKETTVEY